MNNAKKQRGILFLSKEKVDCFVVGLPTVTSMAFPPNVIRSMDVVDKAALVTNIHTFIQTNKILPASFIILLHDSILFEKLLTPPVQSIPISQPSSQTAAVPPGAPQTQGANGNAQTQAQKPVPGQAAVDEEAMITHFIDTVPFEEILQRVIKTEQGKVLVVTNKSLVESIKEGFEKEGSSIESVLPVTVLGKDSILSQGVTVQNGAAVIAKCDSAKSYDMLERVNVQTGPVALGMPQKDSDKKRLFVMLAVFFILIVVLVVFYLRMVAENSKSSVPVSTQPQPIVTVLPTETFTPTPVASSSAEVKQSFVIEIIGTSQNASYSAQLDAQLRQAGYQFPVHKQQGTFSARTLLTFTVDVPQDVQQEVTALVLTYYPDVLVQQNAQDTAKISISY